jgi:hypothetical protein
MKHRILCIMLLVISANPAVFVFGKEVVYLVPAAILALYALMRGVRITPRDIGIGGAIAALSLAHVAVFGSEVLSASLGFLVRVAIALLAVRLVPGFYRHFVSVMVGLSLISVAFYLPVLCGVDLPRLLSPFRVPLEGTEIFHIGIHNFHTPETASRNSGMFGEPGMFAGYLCLAMLLMFYDHACFSVKRLVILVVALLSTLSTTGYVALVPIAVYATLSRRVRSGGRVQYWRALPVLVGICAVAGVGYATIPFVGDKISHQLETAQRSDEGARINRIGNLMFDLDYIKARPLFGWSPRHATRSVADADIEEVAAGQGNGLSGFAVKFGLLGLGTFMWGAYGVLARRERSVVLALTALVVVTIILTGEQFLNAPFFMTLMFLPEPMSGQTAPRHLRRERVRGACQINA